MPAMRTVLPGKTRHLQGGRFLRSARPAPTRPHVNQSGEICTMWSFRRPGWRHSRLRHTGGRRRPEGETEEFAGRENGGIIARPPQPRSREKRLAEAGPHGIALQRSRACCRPAMQERELIARTARRPSRGLRARRPADAIAVETSTRNCPIVPPSWHYTDLQAGWREGSGNRCSRLGKLFQNALGPAGAKPGKRQECQ